MLHYLKRRLLVKSGSKSTIIPELTRDRPSILKAREIGERILDKMKEFVQLFVEGMTA